MADQQAETDRHVTSVSFQKKNSEAEGSLRSQKKLSRENFLQADSDQIDLDALLQAVLDISDHIDDGKGNNNNGVDSARKQYSPESPKDPKQSSGSGFDSERDHRRRNSKLSTGNYNDTNGRQVQEIPFGRRKGYRNEEPRKNMSFSNNRAHDIDRENERLLRKLTKGPPRQKTNSRPKEPVKVMSSSEINRHRQQQKIEQENMAILERLQKVKPSKDVSKQHLLGVHSRRGRRPIKQGGRTPLRRPGSSRSSIYSSDYSSQTSSVADIRDLDNESAAGSPRNSQSQGGSSSTSYTRPFGSTRLKQSTYIKPVWEPGW